MLRKLISAACFALLAFAAVPSYAQQAIPIASCGTLSASLNTAIPHALYMDTSGNLCTAASVSASITGFPTSQSTGTPISVTTGGVTGTLPAGAVVVASNVGTTNNAYCKLGASATTSDQMIPPSSWFAFTVGGATQLTCITSTSTTTVNMVGGSGLPTGSGGGGGGGGGGGAVTVADGADVTQGALADAAVTAGATGTVNAHLRSISRDVMTVNTWASGTLGAMAAYGTSPGAVLVPGVNAFVTNTQAAVGNNADGIAAGASAASPVAAYPYLWNGTTWDRAPGTAAQGLKTSPSPYPQGAVPYTATATGTTAATTATLAGAASVTTYICGFSIRANATAAATGNATVTGVITATLNYTQWTAPLASGVGVVEQIFSPCIPASAANTSIAVVSAAPGSGGTVSVTAWGYKL